MDRDRKQEQHMDHGVPCQHMGHDSLTGQRKGRDKMAMGMDRSGPSQHKDRHSLVVTCISSHLGHSKSQLT